MNNFFKNLRDDVKSLEERLKARKYELEMGERGCQHQWGEVIADHVRHGGYTVDGDPPGTMGIDWRGPMHVPATTEHRWKRECKVCGKVEYTSETEEQVTKKPKFY